MALNKLEEDGHIKINYGEIEIINLDALRQMGNEPQ
jgi:hypothetical protein